ncbi:MAG TPA: hypothetical protein VNI83_05280, partial [Vicinamibacterales bacterium]|nr:hypothetical protein [Vicinamibacterales bacterium]
MVLAHAPDLAQPARLVGRQVDDAVRRDGVGRAVLQREALEASAAELHDVVAARDRHELARRRAEGTHGAVEREVERERLERRARAGAERAPIDERSAPRQAAEQEVLGDAQRRHELRLLVD